MARGPTPSAPTTTASTHSVRCAKTSRTTPRAKSIGNGNGPTAWPTTRAYQRNACVRGRLRRIPLTTRACRCLQAGAHHCRRRMAEVPPLWHAHKLGRRLLFHDVQTTCACGPPCAFACSFRCAPDVGTVTHAPHRSVPRNFAICAAPNSRKTTTTPTTRKGRFNARAKANGGGENKNHIVHPTGRRMSL